jgi:hypothetical protein
MNDMSAGKLVMQIVDGSGVLRQQVEGIKTPGVYFVRIIVGNQLQIRKILKL